MQTRSRSTSAGRTGNAERVEYKSSSSAGTNSSLKSGRPQSAGPSSRGKLHAQGSPRNAVNVQRENAARATYSRQQRPQSAGGARSSSSSAAKTSSRPENRPGSAARRREQASASGRAKLVRPGTAPARRPDNAASIKKMVSDAAHHNQVNDEQTRIRSIVSAETWDGRGRSDMYHLARYWVPVPLVLFAWYCIK